MPRSPLLRCLPSLIFLALVVLALGPALRDGALLSGRYDWRYFESMAEVARRSVAWYGQVPLWNPYSCGGEVDLANPQSLDGAPTFLFTLLAGTAWGFKLAVALYYLLALAGMYQLGRWLGLRVEAALVAAVAFGLSGYLAIHLGAGHINFASVALFPYLVYCFDRSLSRVEWILPTGALAAWVALFGGTFTPALAGELLLLWATGAAWLPRDGHDGDSRPVLRRLARAYGLLLVAALAALFLGAYRMLPALEFIIDHPRPTFRRTPDMTVIFWLLSDLFSWREFGPLPGRKYWSHEYTARLPSLIAPLLLLALPAALQPRWRRLTLVLGGLGLVSVLLCLGNFSPLAPWSILQKLPVLRDLRVPSRHLILVVFFAALLAGVGAQLVIEQVARWRSWAAAALGGLLLLAASVDGVAYTRAQFEGVFTVLLIPPPAPVPFFHAEGHWSQMRELIFQGHGVMRCDEEAPLQRAQALETGDVAQVRLFDPAAGEIIEHRFSPNRRTITVELRRPTQLLLNSNWNEHFHLTKPGSGARVVSLNGRLGVELSGLQPGRHTVEVVYSPRSFAVGLGLSTLAWPLAIWLFVRRRRQGLSLEAGAAA